jgi:Vitamin K-dependent gamma-carboxylase
VRRWFDAWNAYWFPQTDTRALAIARILVIGIHLLWFLPAFASLPEQINLLEKNQDFINPQLVISAIAALLPRQVFFNPEVFTALRLVTVVAGILALVGFFTRTSLFILTLGTWILVAHKYSYGDLHHAVALFAIFLLLLVFAPSGQSLSVDAFMRRRGRAAPNDPAKEQAESDMAMWPLKLAHVLLAMTYFSTGATKLITGGLEWMNGYTLQSYTFQDAVSRNLPLGVWLAQHHGLAVALSIFTIVFETFFFVSLLVPRTAPLFFITGVFFHLGLFATGGHPFFPHIVLLLLLLFFLDTSWWSYRVPKIFRALVPTLAGRHPQVRQLPEHG